MKAFKFYCGQLYYGYAAETKEQAVEKFIDDTGDNFTVCEEIPEIEWDKKTINIWENNDFDKKPFKVSIREQIIGNEPQQIFTNDLSSF